MVWFGSHTLTCVVFLPAACAGAALPYLLAPCPPYPAYMAGYTLLAALVAYLACGLGVGGGLFFTVAALGACTMLLVDGRGSFCSTRSALLAHAFNTFPLSLSVSACFFGIRHVLEKLTFVGHAPPPATAYAQDVGVGVLLSLVLYFHVALVVPFVLVNLRGEAPVRGGFCAENNKTPLQCTLALLHAWCILSHMLCDGMRVAMSEAAFIRWMPSNAWTCKSHVSNPHMTPSHSVSWRPACCCRCWWQPGRQWPWGPTRLPSPSGCGCSTCQTWTRPPATPATATFWAAGTTSPAVQRFRRAL